MKKINATKAIKTVFITSCAMFGLLAPFATQMQYGLEQSNDNFSMIIVSDTQYPWTANTDNVILSFSDKHQRKIRKVS